MVRKICQDPSCGRELGDVHKNRLFCVPCATKRRRDQNRESQKRRRLKKNYPQLLPRAASQHIADMGSAEIEEIIEALWTRLTRTTIVPLFLKLDQRIQQLKIRINHIAGSRTPEWWTNAVSLCNILMEAYSEQPLHKIRKALQKNLCISKQLAIDVMQRAQEQSQFRQTELEWFQ